MKSGNKIRVSGGKSGNVRNEGIIRKLCMICPDISGHAFPDISGHTLFPDFQFRTTPFPESSWYCGHYGTVTRTYCRIALLYNKPQQQQYAMQTLRIIARACRNNIYFLIISVCGLASSKVLLCSTAQFTIKTICVD